MTRYIYTELYRRFIQNGTNQIAAFLRCHGHAWAQISCVVIKHHALIEVLVIGKCAPHNINCNVSSRKTVNFCIPVEQLHILQVTRPSPAGVRGWLCETRCCLGGIWKLLGPTPFPCQRNWPSRCMNILLFACNYGHFAISLGASPFTREEGSGILCITDLFFTPQGTLGHENHMQALLTHGVNHMLQRLSTNAVYLWLAQLTPT